MKKRKKKYVFLVVLTILFGIFAISTVMPSSTASKASMLGYYSHCTFVPISTVICIIVAVMMFIMRKRKINAQK
jgi:hypothetical protein